MIVLAIWVIASLSFALGWVVAISLHPREDSDARMGR